MRPATVSQSIRSARRARWLALAAVCLTLPFTLLRSAQASETADSSAMSHTRVALKVDAEEPIAFRTSFQGRPPTITIEFPKQRVVSTLPEHSAVGQGVIEALDVRYSSGVGLGPQPKRFLQSIRIVLSAPYAYRIQSTLGYVLVEIDHPASVNSAAVEVGLSGGTIFGGVSKSGVTERFRAMQHALAETAGTSLGSTKAAIAPSSNSPSTQPVAASPHAPSAAKAHLIAPARGWLGPQPVSAPQRHARSGGRPTHAAIPAVGWAALALVFLLASAVGFRLAAQLAQADRAVSGRGKLKPPRLPSGVVLIDQLVWRAFERQGYQLIAEMELTHPPFGTLRLIIKEGVKAALLFVGHGPFFEKQTVEQFIRAMRTTNVGQGILVASGSFTVPAQRLAKDHHITLIGREPLIELLSAGAGSEYFTKQLEQSHARLEEAKETIHQYAGELEVLRRQRNEASWYLGEERAKLAGVEAEIAELRQQLTRYEAEVQRWEREAAVLRRQWEESQWYLGESRARIRSLEAQLSDLLSIGDRAATTERARDEAKWYLGEERSARQTLELRLTDLQRELETSAGRERQFQDTLERLTQELAALRSHGERRSRKRLKLPEALVELFNGKEAPLFAGQPRDLSMTGVGLETDQELPVRSLLRIRLTLPGRAPIESRVQLMWQQAGPSRGYQSGLQLLDLPAPVHAELEQFPDANRPSPA